MKGTEHTCTHHWKVESPNGTSFVKGVCKLCNAEKTFRVTNEDGGFIFTDDRRARARKEAVKTIEKRKRTGAA